MIEKLSVVKPVKASFILRGYIPLPISAVTMLNSDGGVGKTRLSLLIADKFSALEGKKSLLWLTEDYPGQVRSIYDELIQNEMAKKESLDNIFIEERDAIQLAYTENRVFKLNADEIEKIGNSIIDVGAELLVLDPLLSFYGGNENDNSQADIFMLGLVKIAQKCKISILLIHHNRKSIDGNDSGVFRGATAFHNKCRCRYSLSKCKLQNKEDDVEKHNAGYRRLRLEKDSWGAIKYFSKLTNGNIETDIKVMPDREKWI